MAKTTAETRRYELIINQILEEVYGPRGPEVRKLIAGMSDEVLNCRAGNHVLRATDAIYEDDTLNGFPVVRSVQSCRGNCGATVKRWRWQDRLGPARSPVYDHTDAGYTETKGLGAPIPKIVAHAELMLRIAQRRIVSTPVLKVA